jgi:hypothetical protein
VIERAAKFSSGAIVNWVVLLCALAGLAVFAGTVGRRTESAAMRQVLFANSKLPASGLEACLAKRVLPNNDGWQVSPQDPKGRQISNPARDLRVVVKDSGSGRRVEIYAAGGIALPDEAYQAVKTCLRGG